MKPPTGPVDLDVALDRLYERAPEEFVGARNDLVKALKAEGRREEAEQVRALRRPTVAAWAVNQLGRRHPQEARALVDAGRELRLAQRRMLSGVQRHGMREASRRRRQAVEAGVARARALLAAAGRRPESYAEAVASSLEAASMDVDAAEALLAGRLEREVAPPSGFGRLTGLSLVPEPEEGDASPTRRRNRKARGARSGEGGPKPREEASSPAGKGGPRRAADRGKQNGDAAVQREREAEIQRHVEDVRRRTDEARREAEAARVAAEHALQEAKEAEQEARRLDKQAAAAHRRAELALAKADRAAKDATARQAAARRLADALAELAARLPRHDGGPLR